MGHWRKQRSLALIYITRHISLQAKRKHAHASAPQEKARGALITAKSGFIDKVNFTFRSDEIRICYPKATGLKL
jgi:hypothetical protein